MEVQLAHWHNEQVTIHLIIAYYNCGENNCKETVQEDVKVISEDSVHDAHGMLLNTQ